jgi:O-antigen ligase
MEKGRVISQVANQLARAELALLLLAAPLFLFFRSAWAPGLLLFPFLWWLRWCSRGHFIPRTPVDWPNLGLLVMILTSLWATNDLAFSLGKVSGTLYGIALFYATVEWGQRCPLRESPSASPRARWGSRILDLAVLVVALGGGAALLSLLGTEWVVKVPILGRLATYLPESIRGMPGAESGFNPNQVTGALIMFVPVQIGLLGAGMAGCRAARMPAPGVPLGSARSALEYAGSLSFTRRYGIVVGAGLSLLLTTLVILLAQSRAAWAALALGLLFLGAIQARSLRLAFVLLIVAGLFGLLVLGPVGVGEWLAQQGWVLSSGEVSWSARVELWSRGLWALGDRPLAGTGMNMFRRVVREQYPLFQFPMDKDVGHVHHTYLQVALDLGLPGLVSYLALLGGALAAGWQRYRQGLPAEERLILLGGLVGLMVHALWGLTDAVALGAKQGFLWWLVIALVVTVTVQAYSRHKQASPPPLAGHTPVALQVPAPIEQGKSQPQQQGEPL